MDPFLSVFLFEVFRFKVYNIQGIISAGAEVVI
jgi:hypothetical protein